MKEKAPEWLDAHGKLKGKPSPGLKRFTRSEKRHFRQSLSKAVKEVLEHEKNA